MSQAGKHQQLADLLAITATQVAGSCPRTLFEGWGRGRYAAERLLFRSRPRRGIARPPPSPLRFWAQAPRQISAEPQAGHVKKGMIVDGGNVDLNGVAGNDDVGRLLQLQWRVECAR